MSAAGTFRHLPRCDRISEIGGSTDFAAKRTTHLITVKSLPAIATALPDFGA